MRAGKPYAAPPFDHDGDHKDRRPGRCDVKPDRLEIGEQKFAAEEQQKYLVADRASDPEKAELIAT